MSACNACFPWNTPLVMREQMIVPGTVAALRFEQWMLFRLHVEQHQGPSGWSGEINHLSDLLKADPLMRLSVPLPQIV